MITIEFRRESVCMGDDINNGVYTIKISEDSKLEDLMEVVLHGGNGNDRHLPYTGANSIWIIESNIGNLAKIYTDNTGEWNIEYIGFNKDMLLKDLDITYIYGNRL